MAKTNNETGLLNQSATSANVTQNTTTIADIIRISLVVLATSASAVCLFKVFNERKKLKQEKQTQQEKKDDLKISNNISQQMQNNENQDQQMQNNENQDQQMQNNENQDQQMQNNETPEQGTKLMAQDSIL